MASERSWIIGDHRWAYKRGAWGLPDGAGRRLQWVAALALIHRHPLGAAGPGQLLQTDQTV